MITFQEYLALEEAIKTPYAYRFVGKDGDLVFAMPYDFSDISSLMKNASQDTKDWLMKDLKKGQYITDKNKKVYLKTDDIMNYSETNPEHKVA
jgi:hypothetical protein